MGCYTQELVAYRSNSSSLLTGSMVWSWPAFSRWKTDRLATFTRGMCDVFEVGFSLRSADRFLQDERGVEDALFWEIRCCYRKSGSLALSSRQPGLLCCPGTAFYFQLQIFVQCIPKCRLSQGWSLVSVIYCTLPVLVSGNARLWGMMLMMMDWC